MTHPLTAFRNQQAPRLTQGQLAARLGVAKHTVSRWESGDRLPRAAMMKRIAEETGIDATALLASIGERSA